MAWAPWGTARGPAIQSEAEAFVIGQFESNEVPAEDVTVSTKENDLGYNFTFGYRFTRYLAAELGLAQFGSVESSGRADVDTGQGVVPVSIKVAFSAGGPMVSAIGILPLNDKFEFYGRLGLSLHQLRTRTLVAREW